MVGYMQIIALGLVVGVVVVTVVGVVVVVVVVLALSKGGHHTTDQTENTKREKAISQNRLVGELSIVGKR